LEFSTYNNILTKGGDEGQSLNCREIGVSSLRKECNVDYRQEGLLSL